MKIISKRIYKLLALFVATAAFCCICETVFADDEKNVSDEIMSEYVELYGAQLDDATGSEALSSIEELIPNFSAEEILEKVSSGDAGFDMKDILNSLIKLLLGEVYRSMKIMILVVALSVLCAYLSNMQDNFAKESVSTVAHFACYILISGILTAAFYDCAMCAKSAINNISTFMQVVVPLFMTALISTGAVVSASVFQPALLSVIEITAFLIETVFLPLAMIGAALNIVNGISDKIKADKLVKLFQGAVKWGLCIMLTIFVGVAGIQSIATAGADGLTVKLTKFAASNLIPVVGSILSESVETIMNCSIVIKNSIGVFGIIAVVLIATYPLIKISAILIIFRISAAVSEPIVDEKIVKCITGLANSVSVIFSMLAAVTVMFVIVLTLMINAGNTTAILGR